MFKKVQEVKDGVETKIKETKDSFGDILKSFSIGEIENKLNIIGYNISRIEISVTLPPRVLFQIDLEKSNIDIEKQEEILNSKENDNTNIVLKKVISGLNAAIEYVKINKNITFNSKKLAYLEVEISFIPTIKLVYLDI